MDVYILLAFITVMAALVTCSRVGGIRKWLGYATALDIAFTMGLLWLFAGTFTGMIVATMAGLMMAVLLSGLKAILGYERLAFERYGSSDMPRGLYWRRYKPTFHMPKVKMPKFRVVMED